MSANTEGDGSETSEIETMLHELKKIHDENLSKIDELGSDGKNWRKVGDFSMTDEPLELGICSLSGGKSGTFRFCIVYSAYQSTVTNEATVWNLEIMPDNLDVGKFYGYLRNMLSQKCW
jgi:hypothetical protein